MTELEMSDFYPEQATPTKTVQNLTLAEQQRQERIDKLINILFIDGKGMKYACNQLGISRTTGYEYFRAWQETEESNLIDTEFWLLYQQVKHDNPEKALEILAKIKIRKIAVKAEINLKEEITETKTFNFNYSEEDKTAILNAYTRIRDKEKSSSPELIRLH